jgi:hypothetical protein
MPYSTLKITRSVQQEMNETAAREAWQGINTTRVEAAAREAWQRISTTRDE